MADNGMTFRIRKEEASSTPNIDNVVKENGREVKLDDEPVVGAQVPTGEEAKPEIAEVKEIVLKGPIGHAYTEVLNHLLSKKDNKTGVIRNETMTQLLVSSVREAEEESENDLSEANRAYIFVNDGRKMNLGEVDEMVTRALEAKKNGAGYVGVAIEGMDSVFDEDQNKGSVISHQVAHLESYGIPTFYTRSRTIGKIESLLGIK